MARYYGLEIGWYETWDNPLGVGTSGRLLLRGHLLGSFYDAGMGGATLFRFDTRELDESIRETLPPVRCADGTLLEPTLELAVAVLADMEEMERHLIGCWNFREREGRALARIVKGGSQSVRYVDDVSSDGDAKRMASEIKAFFGADEVTVYTSIPFLVEGDDDAIPYPQSLADQDLPSPYLDISKIKSAKAAAMYDALLDPSQASVVPIELVWKYHDPNYAGDAGTEAHIYRTDDIEAFVVCEAGEWTGETECADDDLDLIQSGPCPTAEEAIAELAIQVAKAGGCEIQTEATKREEGKGRGYGHAGHGSRP